MKRSTLALIVVVLLAGLAGCSTDGQPEPTETDAPTETPTSTEQWDRDHEVAGVIEQEESIELASVETTDSETVIEIEVTSSDESELARSLGWTAGAYAVIVEENAEAGDATIVIKDFYSGETAGTATVEREWAEQYNSGQIDEQEFAERILRTIETRSPE